MGGEQYKESEGNNEGVRNVRDSPDGDHFEHMGLFLTHGIEGTDMITSVFRDSRGACVNGGLAGSAPEAFFGTQ